DIKRIRKKINVSQGVFAVILNVNPSTVQKWEQGSTTPSGSALRLLNLLEDRGRSLIAGQGSVSA
ncbi:MAG: helix-turn-helix domain-containing protein, partial [Bdellovibrionales bacterium]|nr:helix-turn-helix domain-containing protein [Bdellovibrionales bacterium]